MLYRGHRFDGLPFVVVAFMFVLWLGLVLVLLLLFVYWDCLLSGLLVGLMLICIEFEGYMMQLC